MSFTPAVPVISFRNIDFVSVSVALASGAGAALRWCSTALSTSSTYDSPVSASTRLTFSFTPSALGPFSAPAIASRKRSTGV